MAFSSLRIANSKRQFEQAIIENAHNEKELSSWRTVISNTLEAIEKVIFIKEFEN